MGQCVTAPSHKGKTKMLYDSHVLLSFLLFLGAGWIEAVCQYYILGLVYRTSRFGLWGAGLLCSLVHCAVTPRVDTAGVNKKVLSLHYVELMKEDYVNIN